MKTQTIPVPEGATSIKVEIDDENYPLILKFDDEHDTHYFWFENGKYDGYSRAGIHYNPNPNFKETT